MEERPKCRAVEVQAPSAVNILRNAHPATLIAAGAPREIGVAILGQGCPRARSILCGANALPVGGFRLLHSCINVFCVVEIKVVEGVVLESRAGEPGALGSFYESASASGDVLMTTSLKRVIGRPAPHVFNVTRGRAGEVEHCKGGKAVCCVGIGAGFIDIGVCGAADCYVAIPEADFSGCGACHINLKNDSSRGDVSHCEAHVLDLGGAGFSGFAHHHDRPRIISITKATADA